jgi:DNA-binding LytR/AlgR family response regulator
VTDAEARESDGLNWRLHAVVTVVVLVIGVINALSIAHDAARNGGAYDLGKPLFWELTSVAVIAALAPFVAIGVERLRRVSHERRWWMAAGLAFVIIAGFSAVHIAGMVVLRKTGLAMSGSSYHFAWTPSELAYEFRKDLATCVLLALTFWLALSRRDLARVRKAIKSTSAGTPNRVPGHFWLRDGSTSHRIAPRDVVSLSSAGNYVEYRLVGGTTHLVRATLAKEEPRLQPFGIVRVHRTRMVNLHRVVGVSPRSSGDFELRLDNGEIVTGSRRYRAAIGRLADDPAAAMSLTKSREDPHAGLTVR